MSANPLHLDVKTLENCTQLKKKMSPSVLEQAVKVRKPYTITKQRERWSEEEHNKFLEALKLYGRAWRQIEEHVGTKTAVQIRSHAQKFFTKVVRESSGDNSGEAKTIEIPPPRPKRKPLHPYPRKLGNSPMAPVTEKQELFLLPKISVSDQNSMLIPEQSPHEENNMSPTSVLSDALCSSASNVMSSSSPVSSATAGSNQFVLTESEPDSRSRSDSTSIEDDNKMCQCRTNMEVEMGDDPNMSYKEVSSVEAPVASLKLFGKTVVVADVQKPLQLKVGDSEGCNELSLGSQLRNVDIGQQLVCQVGVQNVMDGAQWNLWPGDAVPVCYSLPSLSVPIPTTSGVWASSALPTHSLNSGLGQSPICGQQSNDRGILEGFADSSCACGAGIAMEDRNNHSTGSRHLGMKFKPSETSAFKIVKTTSNIPLKGFVPYKRCVIEKVDEQKMAVDVGKAQEAQLCL